MENVSLNEIVDEAVISASIGWEALIHTEYGCECNEKRYEFYHKGINPYSLCRLIENMIWNSYDALVEKFGKDKSQRFIRIKTYKKEKFDVFEIEDNGCGMNKETKLKFSCDGYTTKPNGNGIGMRHFKSVLDNLNGEYKLESEINKGTTFRLYFNPT